MPSRKPLSSRRKSATVPPLKIQNSNFGPGDPEGFPNTPPQTPSSISGLIKGKWNSMSIPEVFRKKKPREYKLQVFVAFLFLTIMLLVGSIYVIHKEKELQKAYFEQIRFSGKERKIRVVNKKTTEVLTGILGINFNKKDKPWPCLTENMKANSTCLEWMNRARLYFRKLPPLRETRDSANIMCYEVYWESLTPEFELKDCFYLTHGKGYHWYGGGEMSSNQWPLNRTKIPYSPFVTGNKVNLTLMDNSNSSSETTSSPTHLFEWGRVLSRYFISSPGASVKVTPGTPLHVSLNEDKYPNMLCIGARHGGYPLFNPTTSSLNYSICTADNIRDLENYLADKDIWDGLKHEEAELTYGMTRAPIWRILPHVLNQGNSSEMSLLHHTNKISELLFSEGYILIDETWQKNIGDLTMDSERFATMSETFNITRRRGFKVALTLSPFFSTESPNYVEGLKGGVWLWEKGREKEVPAMTKYKQWHSVALLDSSRPQSQTWFQDKLRKVVSQHGVDAVYLEVGTAQDFPHYYDFPPTLTSADNLGEYFIRTVTGVPGLNTIGVSSAVKLPKLPTFVAMSPTESSWQGLQTVIPNVLLLGTSGYPFIIPGSIGGDYGAPPERNLYIRWLELAHFLPVVQYSYLPSDYDTKVVDIATSLSVTRKSKLLPYLKKAIDDSLTSGLPIIRPLWMLDPTDINCLRISDEFLIGNDILVAPILRFNATDRDIYLPKGKWRDELDGSNTKGEKWLHHYRVRENQIAFFTRDPQSFN
ncbi:unnamed protein product [Allacma fusca]|uniref:Myogenesis-regulating glycosidase n=1 Tax=Allacma fusca TaxID=39272 RepID=A0A8J2KUR0_9HEXA|nr:unnamed protein product [Allacma fusca]